MRMIQCPAPCPCPWFQPTAAVLPDFVKSGLKEVQFAEASDWPAGKLIHDDPSISENEAMLRAIVGACWHRMVSEDMPLFQALLADVFPGKYHVRESIISLTKTRSPNHSQRRQDDFQAGILPQSLSHQASNVSELCHAFSEETAEQEALRLTTRSDMIQAAILEELQQHQLQVSAG